MATLANSSWQSYNAKNMIVEVKKRPGYTQGLEVNTEGPIEAARMHQQLEHFPELKFPYKMLAIGCGAGYVVEDFRKNGVEAYGLEIIGDMLPKNKGYFIQGDGCFVPFPNETFRVVCESALFAYLMGTLCEVPNSRKNAERILEEMDRILMPGGYLYSAYGPIPNEKYLLSRGYKDLSTLDYYLSAHTLQKPK